MCLDIVSLIKHITRIQSIGGKQMFVGFMLLIIGILMVLSRADIIPGDAWDYILPIALIAFGAKMIFDNKKKIED